jgi:hypothetical protein
MKKKYKPFYAGNHSGDIPRWNSPRQRIPHKGTLFSCNAGSVPKKYTIPASPITVHSHRSTVESFKKTAQESPSSLGQFRP